MGNDNELCRCCLHLAEGLETTWCAGSGKTERLWECDLGLEPESDGCGWIECDEHVPGGPGED